MAAASFLMPKETDESFLLSCQVSLRDVEVVAPNAPECDEDLASTLLGDDKTHQGFCIDRCDSGAVKCRQVIH